MSEFNPRDTQEFENDDHRLAPAEHEPGFWIRAARRAVSMPLGVGTFVLALGGAVNIVEGVRHSNAEALKAGIALVAGAMALPTAVEAVATDIRRNRGE